MSHPLPDYKETQLPVSEFYFYGKSLRFSKPVTLKTDDHFFVLDPSEGLLANDAPLLVEVFAADKNTTISYEGEISRHKTVKKHWAVWQPVDTFVRDVLYPMVTNFGVSIDTVSELSETYDLLIIDSHSEDVEAVKDYTGEILVIAGDYDSIVRWQVYAARRNFHLHQFPDSKDQIIEFKRKLMRFLPSSCFANNFYVN